MRIHILYVCSGACKFQSRNGSRESGLESLRFVSDAFDGLRDRPDDDNGVANGDCNLWAGKTKKDYFQSYRWTNTMAISIMRHDNTTYSKLLHELCTLCKTYVYEYMLTYYIIIICYAIDKHNTIINIKIIIL